MQGIPRYILMRFRGGAENPKYFPLDKRTDINRSFSEAKRLAEEVEAKRLAEEVEAKRLEDLDLNSKYPLFLSNEQGIDDNIIEVYRIQINDNVYRAGFFKWRFIIPEKNRGRGLGTTIINKILLDHLDFILIDIVASPEARNFWDKFSKIDVDDSITAKPMINQIGKLNPKVLNPALIIYGEKYKNKNIINN